MLDRASAPLLAVEKLEAWYGESHILHGVNLEVRAGEVVTLLGRNGAGKTTTLKSIMGVVPRRQGSIRFEGKELIQLTADKIARVGIAFCPEERGIFASLDVRENLLLPPALRPGGLSLERIFELFPNLRERLNTQGTKLSGGEQQMLAIGRGLMANPRLLLLDEPSLGLAPFMVQKIRDIIADINASGTSVLLVEQNAQMALSIATHGYVLETGKVALAQPAAQLLQDESVRKFYLGLHEGEERNTFATLRQRRPERNWAL
jgi:branched-chain amino acid transport system ATP-binding protein